MLAGTLNFAAVRMQYWFEKRQLLQFALVDQASGTVIGLYEVTLGKIMGSTAQIHRGQIDQTEIIIRAATPQETQPTGKLTFQDWVRSGWQISQTIAIDYTSSNRDQRSKNSLHFLGPNNQYEASILEVGGILEQYDSDGNFPVYGFGGVTGHMPKHELSHCFPLTGNMQQPEVKGVAGVLEIYKQTLPSIQLNGPTYFCPVLQSFKQKCISDQGKKIYNVLLLLTDGQAGDMDNIKALIVDLSAFACSIIIIGVGNANFSSMRVLDGDGPKGLKDRHGRPVERDIVQFVEFTKAIQQGDLAEQVLAELPGQFLSHVEKFKAEHCYTPQLL